jgi:aminomethyltransferase
LFSESGEEIGRVTSGGFGPSANHPVAMGYVPKPFSSPGTIVFADVRGAKIPVAVHTLPFVPHTYFRG